MGWPYALALLLGGLIVGQIWARRSRRLWGVGTARPGLTLGAIAALIGALVTGVRGLWWEALVLMILAGALTAIARGRALSGERSPPPAPRAAAMTRAEAAGLLGVSNDASPDDVQAAYRRLMRAVHPDQGGTAGLAAQLNAARDALLARR